MTVTKRRVKADTGVEGSAATEPGIQYTCDACSIDITHTVRIKCAAQGCEEVDLCPNCFSEGKELGGHKAWHDYRVVETHSRPIFSEDWGADEELLLISGLQTYGLGNWAEVADYVGTRLKEDCERHYTETYLAERSSTKKDVHRRDPNGKQNGHSTTDRDEDDVTGRSSSQELFANAYGEMQHDGLCTTASVINSIGGVGGFGRVTTSGQLGKKRRQGWWGGLPVGEGWTCPMPRMKARFEITQEEFQSRKKRRIEELRKPAPLPAAAIETKASAPQNHEVAGYMPGRLEFDHEVENEAEMVIKDMDFGLVFAYGGDGMREGAPPAGGRDGIGNEPDDDADEDARAARPQQQSAKTVGSTTATKTAGGKGSASKKPAGAQSAGDTSVVNAMDVDEAGDEEDRPLAQLVDAVNHDTARDSNSKRKGKDEGEEEKAPAVTLEEEDLEDMELKLIVLEVYYSRLGKRQQAKDFIFDRGLMDYKRLMAQEKKRGKEEAGLINRYKVFAKMQTAEDFEVLVDGLIYEQTLRKKIAELQDYRRNGVTTIADALRFDRLRNERASGVRPGQGPVPREPMTSSDAILQRRSYGGGDSVLQDKVAKTPYPGPPLHFLHADDLQLLSPEEQTLCCELHVLPRPYLLIKDAIVRECARRGGDLQRHDAGRLFEIPYDITCAIFDHLRTSGILIDI